MAGGVQDIRIKWRDGEIKNKRQRDQSSVTGELLLWKRR